MERRNSKEWINSLKIAIINNDLHKIEEYSKREIPSFESIEEAKEALKLVNQATNILETQQYKISQQLRALKQNKQYTQSYKNNSTFNFQA
jgi:hypothetical protein